MRVSVRYALAVSVGTIGRDERAVQQAVVSVRAKRGTLERWHVVTVPKFE